MTTPARRRLMHDFKKLQEEPPTTGMVTNYVKELQPLL